MKREDLKQYLIDHNYPSGLQLLPNSRKHGQILDDLKYETSFLDEVFENVKPATRCFCILYDIYEVPLCLNCGSYTNLGRSSEEYARHYTKSGFTRFCSVSCSAKGTYEKRKQTNLKNHGVEHQMHRNDVKEKIDQTNLERYGSKRYFATKEYQEQYKKEYKEKTGYDHHFANPEVIKKREERNIENHGLPNAFQFSKDKILKTNLDRHGVEYPLQNEEIKKKVLQTNTEIYGVPYPLQNEDIKEKVRITSVAKYNQISHTRSHFTDLANEILFDKEKLQTLYNEIPNIHKMAQYLNLGSGRTVLLAMNRFDIKTNSLQRTSSAEIEIQKYLDSLNVNYEVGNTQLIGPKELDIYIPDQNIAIEYNGSYWHSDIFKKKEYHQEKALMCKDLGIKLIHIYEDQWENENKKRILKEKISRLLGESNLERIYARKCQIKELKAIDTKEFYNFNHIQGYNPCSINYGLYYNESMVACISFKDLGNDNYDLVRYATSCNVIGGFGKLWSYFKKHIKFSKVLTYASLDYSHGEVYEKIGFNLDYITGPNYFYVDKYGLRYSRQYFMKNKLEAKLEIYDGSITEKQNVKNNGYYLIYDSGSLKYSFTN